jgi:hypothetical protein
LKVAFIAGASIVVVVVLASVDGIVWAGLAFDPSPPHAPTIATTASIPPESSMFPPACLTLMDSLPPYGTTEVPSDPALQRH